MKPTVVATTTTLILVVLLGACGSGNEADHSLLVGAAISLQPVLDRAITAYGGVDSESTVTVSYAGSGTLRRQVEFGAPIDIFLSAAPEHIDTLIIRGLVDPATRTAIASNRLVLIASRNRPPLGMLQDLRLPGISRIAIGQPDIVPAGRYAYQALERTGILPDIGDKIVFTKDVQQVLVYVRTGSVDAGFVYASDVFASTPVRVIDTLPDSLHAPILYEGIVCIASKRVADAGRFLAFLRSDTVRTMFITYGFLPAGV